jgi:hypothetical protein
MRSLILVITIRVVSAAVLPLLGLTSLLHVSGEVLTVHHCQHAVQSEPTGTVAIHIQGLDQRSGIRQPCGFNDHPI